MYQKAMDSNKVSMELLNLEVINRNRLGKFFPFNGFNKRRAAAQQFKLIADLQILSENPALSLYEKGMSRRSGNLCATNLHMNQFVLFIPEELDYSL